MSQEILEISVRVDEYFDVEFNWAEGVFGLIVEVCEKLNIK